MKEENIYGYAGKILRINLSNNEIYTEPTYPYIKDWLGSPGIAIKILYDELKDWVTPYDPANKIIFGVGILIGTTAPGANKTNVSTLGPVTGGWASSCSDSYVGGEIKRSGYDMVVISGKAHTPVYIYIKDDIVEIRDACHLWGKTTWETLDIIRDELNDRSAHILSIGPAGENLVRGANIIQDKGRAMGRCGVGAVMGSKNLKLIVAKGSHSIKVAQPEKFMKEVSKIRKDIKSLPGTPAFHDRGTLSIFDGKQAVSGISWKNFQILGVPEDKVDKVHPSNIMKYEIAKQSYPGCPFGGCSGIFHITEGPYAGLVTERNQWEVLGTLQCRLAVEDPTFMLKVNSYCNQLGYDVDMAGGTIGWAMECFQRGIIDEKDTDGLKLNWGDAGVALELVRKTAYREGFGNILAEGNIRAADIIGRDSSYYALNIKKQDLYEPCRGAMGWALGTITSTRGGGHTTGAPWCETVPNFDLQKAKQVFGVENAGNPLGYEDKPQMVKYTEVLHRVNNCLGICHFATVAQSIFQMDLPDIAKLYSYATGIETTVEDFIVLAMRQLNLEKAFNLRFTDFDRKDDMPTPRDLNEPMPSGKNIGWKIEEDKWNKMLDEYYDIHGWDRETSYPKKETLISLGLEYVVKDLEKIGKLR